MQLNLRAHSKKKNCIIHIIKQFILLETLNHIFLNKVHETKLQYLYKQNIRVIYF